MVVSKDDLLKRENEIKEADLDLEKIINHYQKRGTNNAGYLPKNIKEKLEYITQELDLDKKVFEKNPVLFGLTRENLEPKVEYITQELDLDKKVFEKFPALFNFSRENLEPKFEYITQELDLDKKVFEKKPNLFSYSMSKRIWPRLELIREKGLNFDARMISSPEDSFLHQYEIEKYQLDSKIDQFEDSVYAKKL